MSPEKIPTRTRLALAQKMRRRSRLPASRDTSPSLDVVLASPAAGRRRSWPSWRDCTERTSARSNAGRSAPLLCFPAPAALVLPKRHVSVDNLEKLADAFELPVPELLTPPSPADLAEHFKDLGIEEPRAYYGPVAIGVMH